MVSRRRLAEGSQPGEVVGQDPPPKVDACPLMAPHAAVLPLILARPQADGGLLARPPALQLPELPLDSG